MRLSEGENAKAQNKKVLFIALQQNRKTDLKLFDRCYH